MGFPSSCLLKNMSRIHVIAPLNVDKNSVTPFRSQFASFIFNLDEFLKLNHACYVNELWQFVFQENVYIGE